MKIIKNIITLMLFFSAFFVLYFMIYLFKVLDTNNIFQHINLNLVKSLMGHYLFAIIILSANSSVIIIGTLNKFSGRLSTIISMLILSLLISLYPVYTVVSNKNIDYLRNELNDKSSLFIDESGRYFTKIDNYLIKIGYKLLDNTYKNVILIDPVYMGSMYIGDYVYITDEEISLHEVTEIKGISRTKKTSSVFERNSINKYMSNFTEDIVFGFEAFPIISALLKILTLSNISPYYIILLFINFFMLFFSFYMLGLSLHSRQYIYHNILNAFIIYAVIKIVLAIFITQYNLLELVARNMNYSTINLYMFIISVMIIIISLILKKILNNDKHATNN